MAKKTCNFIGFKCQLHNRPCYKSDFLRGMIKGYKIKETFNFIQGNRVKKMHPSPDLYIYAISVYLEDWNIQMKTMLNIDIANKFVNDKKN